MQGIEEPVNWEKGEFFWSLVHNNQLLAQVIKDGQTSKWRLVEYGERVVQCPRSFDKPEEAVSYYENL